MASAVGDANFDVEFVFPTSKEMGHPFPCNPFACARGSVGPPPNSSCAPAMGSCFVRYPLKVVDSVREILLHVRPLNLDGVLHRSRRDYSAAPAGCKQLCVDPAVLCSP